jgi:GntR family transcriptional regulator
METAELVRRLQARVRGGSAEPVAQLVGDEIWLAVVDGSLESGQRLPTARELAVALGVSPRSIEHAFAELERRGVLATRPGAGSQVSLTRPSEQELARHQELARLCRATAERAAELGFGIDDVLDVLTEFRSVDPAAEEPLP